MSKHDVSNESQVPFSRRTFLSTAIAASALTAEAATDSSSLLNVDFRKLVSRADLIYEKPVARSEEGIPVGNGRMGSLVWTIPSSMKFQINRADVYANDSYTNSFFERHADYCCGCGFVDIDFVQFGEEVFPTTVRGSIFRSTTPCST